MKLKTKLIPLTGLSLLGTTIVPLTLTSCGSGKATGNSFNLVKNYFPTIQRHDADITYISDVNNIYVEQLLNNPDTFTQDYLWSKSWMGAGFNQFAFIDQIIPDDPTPIPEPPAIYVHGIPSELYQYDREIISNLSIHTTRHKDGSQLSWSQAVLSFTLKFDSEVLTKISEEPFIKEGTDGYVNGHVSGEINFYNVPFVIKQRFIQYKDKTTISPLSFEPDYGWMIKDPAETGLEPWKIKFYIASTISGEITSELGYVERIANDFVFLGEATPESYYWPEYRMDFGDITKMFSSSYYLERIRVVG